MRNEGDVNPNALATLEAKFTTKVSKGEKPRKISRRTGAVTITPEMCEPDTFDGPIVIGLEAINSSTELEAMKESADGASAGFAMARKGMRTLNGAPMKKHQADLVWECLGFKGRTMVVNAYLTQCTGAGEDVDVGKSQEETE